LGYMILGLGVGAWTFALFHLITHAFFKCCLFQCSGSVINAMHHEQDMRHYGGLWRKMPLTALAFLVCTLAIAGASIPYTDLALSGYYSKDGIIAGAFNYSEVVDRLGWVFYLGPVLIAFVTPFYMARALALTFLGTPRDTHRHEHAREAPWTMVVPQLVLAFMAIVSGWSWFLWKPLILGTEKAMGIETVQHAAALEESHGMHSTHAVLLHGFAWILALGAGVLVYQRGFTLAAKIAKIPPLPILHRWALDKFYFDALYDVFAVALGKAIAHVARALDTYVVDGLVNLAAFVGRRLGAGVGLFDSKVVDGAFNGAASMTQGGGSVLRGTHAGRIRGYVLLLFAGSVIALLAVVVVASRGAG